CPCASTACITAARITSSSSPVIVRVHFDSLGKSLQSIIFLLIGHLLLGQEFFYQLVPPEGRAEARWRGTRGGAPSHRRPRGCVAGAALVRRSGPVSGSGGPLNRRCPGEGGPHGRHRRPAATVRSAAAGRSIRPIRASSSR